ncbi:hypothetical protein Prudu_001844 [Prunus dulcis]|uniref:Uncharacterized protein n=1 Tax=Prunus dulcis TaxID=3755 RepID=A0A4Y1QPE3_PRUDU|nr:hypothetical protein Prudu_001844 [Prunus dulcis]
MGNLPFNLPFNLVVLLIGLQSINAWMQFVAYGWRKMHRGCSKIAVFWIIPSTASAPTFNGCGICERPFQRTENKQEVASKLVEKKNRLQNGWSDKIALKFFSYPICS